VPKWGRALFVTLTREWVVFKYNGVFSRGTVGWTQSFILEDSPPRWTTKFPLMTLDD